MGDGNKKGGETPQRKIRLSGVESLLDKLVSRQFDYSARLMPDDGGL